MIGQDDLIQIVSRNLLRQRLRARTQHDGRGLLASVAGELLRRHNRLKRSLIQHADFMLDEN